MARNIGNEGVEMMILKEEVSCSDMLDWRGRAWVLVLLLLV